MKKTQYLALLRGINVGGNNIIKMADLKSCFMEMGFSDVITYIQSGNVIFTSSETDKKLLTKIIEKALSERFSYRSLIVLVEGNHLRRVVERAPMGFGANPDEFRYEVLFLLDDFTPDEAIKDIRLREGVDTVDKGDRVLYFSRLISGAGQSYLNKIISLPVYQQMTIRNWNTTTRLLELLKSGSENE